MVTVSAVGSGPSVVLTRLPRRQILNANGWDTGWGRWLAAPGRQIPPVLFVILEFGNRVNISLLSSSQSKCHFRLKFD
jgi:hypothetical protein